MRSLLSILLTMGLKFFLSNKHSSLFYLAAKFQNPVNCPIIFDNLQFWETTSRFSFLLHQEAVFPRVSVMKLFFTSSLSLHKIS
jgi:hypothetical protein